MLDPATLRATAAIEHVVFSAWLIIWREWVKPNSLLTHLDKREALRRQTLVLELTEELNGTEITIDEILRRMRNERRTDEAQ